MNKYQVKTIKLILVGIIFAMLLYYGFEYDSWVALSGAFVSFWVIIID